MVVNSINFWIFFLGVLFIYYGLFRNSSRWQNITLLISSFIFYGLVDWLMCALLLSAIVIFYALGLAIDKYNKINSVASFRLTILGVCLGVGLLLYFKYLGFFVDQFSLLLGSFGLNTNWNTFSIIMPLGISFFTFKLIGYVIEVYRENLTSTKDLISFGIYIAYFPTIMSGPIDNPKKFMPQLESTRTVDYAILAKASKRILWGMFLKMCIADNICVITSDILTNWNNYNSGSIILASVLYSFQIYADFAGYSEMAIGTSQILGISISENFQRPYFSKSISDFWKRWHISLTKWLTQYVYISLGGNRCSKIRHYFNIMITFLVSGLWHGANWTFVIWGFLHGAYQIIEKLLGVNNSTKNSKQVYRPSKILYIKGVLAILITFALVTFNWILFQSDSILSFFGLIGSIFNNWGWPQLANFPSFASISFAIVIMFFKEVIDEYNMNFRLFNANSYVVRVLAISFIVMYILCFGSLDGGNFIYFNF